MLKLFVSQKVRAAFPCKLKVTPIYVSAEGQHAHWSWTSLLLTIFTFCDTFIWNTVDFKIKFKCKTNCFRWRDYLTKPKNFEGMRSRWSMEVSRILLTKRDDWQDYIWPDIRSSWTFFRGIGKYDINMVNAYRQHDRLFQNEKINCDYFCLLIFVGRVEFNSVPLDSKSIFSWATVQFVIALETHFQSGSTQPSWCCYCLMVSRKKDKYM